MLSTRRVVFGVGLLAALVALSQFGGAAVAGAQSQAATQRVIVIFKNQETSLPPTRGLVGARKHALQAIQAPVTQQLSASGAKSVHSFTVLNAVSATVSSGEAAQLKSDPAVSEVIPNTSSDSIPREGSGLAGTRRQ